jgi:hypothetical protein
VPEVLAHQQELTKAHLVRILFFQVSLRPAAVAEAVGTMAVLLENKMA